MRDTEWFYQKKWGVFLHYLEFAINGENAARSMGRSTGWDECISEFDCDAFAKQLHELGAGYLMLTLQQQTKHLCAPNETFNQITGYKSGEACSSIDLVGKMLTALEPYSIDLFLYYTGDGPFKDDKSAKGFEYSGYGPPECNKVHAAYVRKWASVLEEYSRRYGSKIKGWWLDGMYRVIGYDDLDLIKIMTDAARSGNEDALVACNYYGCMDEYGSIIMQNRSGTPYCDYSSGEMVYLGDLPYGPMIGAQRWHVLSFLGKSPDNYDYNGWGAPGSRYSGEYLREYITKIHEKGGVLTLDICAYRDGHIDPVQIEVLSHLKNI